MTFFKPASVCLSLVMAPILLILSSPLRADTPPPAAPAVPSTQPVAVDLDTKFGTVRWFEGARYYWYSGGNHYDQKWVEMHTLDGHAQLTVHSDDTYRINRQDYVIDLSAASVTLAIQSYANAKAQVAFDLDLATSRPEFRGLLAELAATLRVVARGFAYPGIDLKAPPAPELASLASYFEAIGAP